MLSDERNSGESGAGLVRGVAVILLVGIALGVGYNLMMLASGPRHGLAWIKQETKLASLEDQPAASPNAPGATSEQPGATSASPPGAVPAASAATTQATPSPGATTPSHPSASAARPSPARATSETPPRGAPPRANGTATGTAPPAGSPPTSTPSQPAVTGTAPPPAPTASLPVIPETREPLEVQYGTIKKFWDARAAVFVDARTSEEYSEGHIPGAVNLPFDDVFKDPDLAKKFDSGGKPIITYCGGGDCELSKNLAFSLIEGGHKRVLVFMGGLPGWKDGGNTVATGSSPGAPQ